MDSTLFLTPVRPLLPLEKSAFDLVLAEVFAGPNVDVVCPYLSVHILKRLLPESTALRLVTDASVWVRSFSHVERPKILSFVRANHSRVRSLQGVHAKVALGAQVAYLGSANLTDRGLYSSLEAGVAIRDSGEVKRLREWFADLWEAAKPIDLPHLERLAAEAPEPVNPADAIADRGSEFDPLVSALSLCPSRAYADRFLSFIDSMTSLLQLSEADERVALSLPKNGSVALTINNRYSILSSRGPRQEVGVIISARFVAAPELESRVRDLGRYLKGPQEATDPPAFGWLDLAEVEGNAEIEQYIVSSLREQLKRAKRSSNRAHHSHWTWVVVKDLRERGAVLSAAFPSP